MLEYLKTGLVLMVITLVAGFSLSLIYELVKEPIAEAELQEKLQAIRTVLKDYATSEPIMNEDKIPSDSESLDRFTWDPEGFVAEAGVIYTSPSIRGAVYSPVYRFELPDNGQVFVLVGESQGYGGPVSIVSSFIVRDGEVILNGIEVIEYAQETPGLGANISYDEVKERFYPVERSGLQAGLKVDKDAGVSPTTDTELMNRRRREEGIIQTSDVMTGATITANAVINALNLMYEFLSEAGVLQ